MLLCEGWFACCTLLVALGNAVRMSGYHLGSYVLPQQNITKTILACVLQV